MFPIIVFITTLLPIITINNLFIFDLPKFSESYFEIMSNNKMKIAYYLHNEVVL